MNINIIANIIAAIINITPTVKKSLGFILNILSRKKYSSSSHQRNKNNSTSKIVHFN